MSMLKGVKKNTVLAKIMMALYLIISFTGCATKQTALFNTPYSDYQVKVWMEESRHLRVGNEVAVNVRSNRDCYLHVYYLASTGIIRQIYPNSNQKDHFLASGKIIRIPEKNSSFRFVLTPPPGTETIVAVATRKPIKVFPEESIDNQGAVSRVKLNKKDFFEVLEKELNKHNPADSGTDTCFFSYW